MQSAFPYLIVALMFVTLAVLITGVLNMGGKAKTKKQTKARQRRANILMRWRVVCQAAAIILFLVFIFLYR